MSGCNLQNEEEKKKRRNVTSKYKNRGILDRAVIIRNSWPHTRHKQWTQNKEKQQQFQGTRIKGGRIMRRMKDDDWPLVEVARSAIRWKVSKKAVEAVIVALSWVWNLVPLTTNSSQLPLDPFISFTITWNRLLIALQSRSMFAIDSIFGIFTVNLLYLYNSNIYL